MSVTKREHTRSVQYERINKEIKVEYSNMEIGFTRDTKMQSLIAFRNRMLKNSRIIATMCKNCGSHTVLNQKFAPFFILIGIKLAIEKNDSFQEYSTY